MTSPSASPVDQHPQTSAPCTAAALFDAAVRAEHINPKDSRYGPGGPAEGQASVTRFKCYQGWAYGDVGRPDAGFQDGGTLFGEAGGRWSEVAQYDLHSGPGESACELHTKFGVPLTVVNHLSQWPTPCATNTSSVDPSWTTYRTYVNGHFHFKVDVPLAMKGNGPYADGFGQNFFSSDRNVELSAYGQTNPNGDSAQTLKAKVESQWAANGGRVTYATTLDQGFIVSGVDADGFIYYQRDFVFSRVVYVMLWIYPSSMKAQLDTAVTHSFATFSPGQT